MKTNSILDYFPFPNIRPAQISALLLIEKAVEAGKKYIVIEAPTGVGKSGIAMAVANWAASTLEAGGHNPDERAQLGAYILSTQKSLTAQYMADFREMGLVEMRGRSNFGCYKTEELGQGDIDCDSGPEFDCGKNEDGSKDEYALPCSYKEAKKAFVKYPVGVTNFSYFLSEVNHVGSLPDRTFLIVDECHNAERQLLDFWSLELTQQRCKELNLFSMPEVTNNEQGSLRVWLENTFLPMAEEKVRELMSQAEQMKKSDVQLSISLRRRAKGWDSFITKLNAFALDTKPENWFVYTEDRSKNLIFKRFSAAPIAHEMLLKKGMFTLFMSATILDIPTFLRNLGIKPEEAATLKLDSEFPVENRPVIAWYAGNMNRDTIDRTLPKMVLAVERILDQYIGQKGIIHTHSYKVMQAVMEHLRGTKHAHRLTTHTSEKGSREMALERHRLANFGSVIISPSMAEGLDLKGDLSRFQIIMKVPYPALDAYTNARKNHDPNWYTLQTGLTLIQASGRSVRSKTDWADTFILDQGFHSFFTRNYSVLSPWWSKSVRVIKQDQIQEIFDALRKRTAA